MTNLYKFVIYDIILYYVFFRINMYQRVKIQNFNNFNKTNNFWLSLNKLTISSNSYIFFYLERFYKKISKNNIDKKKNVGRNLHYSPYISLTLKQNYRIYNFANYIFCLNKMCIVIFWKIML